MGTRTWGRNFYTLVARGRELVVVSVVLKSGDTVLVWKSWIIAGVLTARLLALVV